MMANLILYAVAAITLTSGICNAQQEANVCTGLPQHSLVRNTNNCATYFHCFNGIPINSTCPAGHLFDYVTRNCDLAVRVECFKCPADQPFVDLHVPNECNQFVRCFNNASQQLTCAEGLIFDRDLQMCNVHNAAKCPFEVFCPSENIRPIFTRDRDDCSRFYVCLNGIPDPRECPSSLFFNPITEMCDLRQNTECPHYIPGGDVNDNEPIPENFRCPEHGGPLHPSHEDCQIFYTCSPDGMALRNKCGPNQFFHYQYMFCGNLEDVVCYSGTSVFV